MTSEDERLEILEMIQRGTISAQEGLQLIEAMDESWEDEQVDDLSEPEIIEGEPMVGKVSGTPSGEEMDRWRDWWVIPFWIGIGITILGGGLMYLAWSSNGIGFGFALTWILFLIGIGVTVLGWNSKTGPWIHIRILQKPGETPERIAISLPLPIRFIAWIARTFNNFIPDHDIAGLDEIILAIKRNSPGDPPLSINVKDEDDQEQVDIFIG